MIHKLFLLIVFIFASHLLFAQNHFINNRVGYFYAMKIFHIDPADSLNKRWVYDYLETFDYSNYNLKKNDEFEKGAILPDAITVLRRGIDSVQFDTTTYVIGTEGTF